MTRLMLGAAVVYLCAGAAPATTFSKKTTKDLVNMAERVCCVRCEGVEQRLDRASGLVFTHVRLRLLEDMKGRTEGTVVELRLIGGRAGNAVTEVDGMPKFSRGRECVLLLGKHNRLGYPVLVQARRGVFELKRDKKTGERHIARTVTAMPGLPEARRVTLDRFREAVKRIVREAKKARR